MVIIPSHYSIVIIIGILILFIGWTLRVTSWTSSNKIWNSEYKELKRYAMTCLYTVNGGYEIETNLQRDGESGNRLLSSADKHKIVLHTDKKRSLGFSVRGGAEYSLGIYVSM